MLCALPEQASVYPQTITRFSKGETEPLDMRPRRTGVRRRMFGPLTVTKWSDGVDPRVAATVEHMIRTEGIDFRCIEVITPIEVIIHNNTDWKVGEHHD